MGCHTAPATSSGRWNANYSYVDTVPPITFHYDHGVLAGSYPGNVETLAIKFEDVCAQLGHVCLCGAGGFRIAEKAVEAMRQDGAPSACASPGSNCRSWRRPGSTGISAGVVGITVVISRC